MSVVSHVEGRWAKDAFISGAMRLRIGLPRQEWSADVACPGCGAADLLPEEVAHHLRGCTRVRGKGTASAAAMLTRALGHICDDAGIARDVCQPCDVGVRYCPGCALHVPVGLEADHCAMSEGRCAVDKLHASRLRRPDLRMYFASGAVVVDTTDVGIATRSMVLVGLQKAFQLRAQEKRRLYEPAYGAAEARDDEASAFVCMAVTPNGALCSGTQRVLKKIADESHERATAVEVFRRFRRANALAQGMALDNAEQQAIGTRVDFRGMRVAFQAMHLQEMAKLRARIPDYAPDPAGALPESTPPPRVTPLPRVSVTPASATAKALVASLIPKQLLCASAHPTEQVAAVDDVVATAVACAADRLVGLWHAASAPVAASAAASAAAPLFSWLCVPPVAAAAPACRSTGPPPPSRTHGSPTRRPAAAAAAPRAGPCPSVPRLAAPAPAVLPSGVACRVCPPRRARVGPATLFTGAARRLHSLARTTAPYCRPTAAAVALACVPALMFSPSVPALCGLRSGTALQCTHPRDFELLRCPMLVLACAVYAALAAQGRNVFCAALCGGGFSLLATAWEGELVRAVCFAMLAYIGHGGALESMLVAARAGLAVSELWAPPSAPVVAAARLLTLTHVLLALLRRNAELSAVRDGGRRAIARGRVLLSRAAAAGALFVLLLAPQASSLVSPIGLALPLLLDAIALVDWAVDPVRSLWLSRVRTALLFVAVLGPTDTWVRLHGVFGPPDAWAYWDPGAGPALALANLPSAEAFVRVANVAHGLAGGAAYALRPGEASNSMLISSALTLLIEGALLALPEGEFALRMTARLLPFSLLDCDLSSAASQVPVAAVSAVGRAAHRVIVGALPAISCEEEIDVDAEDVDAAAPGGSLAAPAAAPTPTAPVAAAPVVAAAPPASALAAAAAAAAAPAAHLFSAAHGGLVRQASLPLYVDRSDEPPPSPPPPSDLSSSGSMPSLENSVPAAWLPSASAPAAQASPQPPRAVPDPQASPRRTAFLDTAAGKSCLARAKAAAAPPASPAPPRQQPARAAAAPAAVAASPPKRTSSAGSRAAAAPPAASPVGPGSALARLRNAGLATGAVFHPAPAAGAATTAVSSPAPAVRLLLDTDSDSDSGRGTAARAAARARSVGGRRVPSADSDDGMSDGASSADAQGRPRATLPSRARAAAKVAAAPAAVGAAAAAPASARQAVERVFHCRECGVPHPPPVGSHCERRAPPSSVPPDTAVSPRHCAACNGRHVPPTGKACPRAASSSSSAPACSPAASAAAATPAPAAKRAASGGGGGAAAGGGGARRR